MTEKLTSFKFWISGLFGAVSAFLGWRGVLFVLLFVLACIDFGTGWFYALKSGNWKSSIAREGVAHKVGMFVIVVVSGMMDLCLYVICKLIPDFSFTWGGLLLPFVLAWYIITEFGSIIENASLLGAPVPAWLVKMLEVGKKAIDNSADKNISNSGENN